MDVVSAVYAQWVWLKILGLAYLVAFASLLPQVRGLYGAHGICPIKEVLDHLRTHEGKKPFFRCPTLFWFNASDKMLVGVAIAGVIVSILFLLGVYPAILMAFLWLFYLSFCTVGSEFLSYQWDALLLEMGFLGIFFAMQTPPGLPMVLLVYFFAFRFAFSSGIVKWLSRDPSWRKFTALDVHYFTQPLPNPLSWYAHQQPCWLSRATCFLTLFIEIVLPFFIPLGEDVRIGIFLAWVALQGWILLTGNYTFFNVLTLGILVILLPDRVLEPLVGWIAHPNPTLSSPLVENLSLVVASLLGLFNLAQLASFFYHPLWLRRLLRKISPYYLCNRYGLFAVMTTSRKEIEIEGSYNGMDWMRYEFKYKPSDPFKMPPQVAPHQPRLDWQMWFAALSSYDRNITATSWFGHLLLRLLEGSKDVDSLLHHNPFIKGPPRFIRATLYEYTFSSPEEKKKTSRWWTRDFLGGYGPVVELERTVSDDKV